MKNNSLVSVIMSTLNTKEEYLIPAIESILNQTYKNLELIIVIDGGNDDILIKKAFDDNRIKFIKHDTPMGLPYSLNEAIDMCKGDYIARMDSDDISLKNRISEQVNYMNKHRDIDICSVFYKKFGSENKYVYNIWPSYNDVKIQLIYTNVLAHPGIIFRRKFLEKFNLKYSIEYKYSQDFEFWNRCKKYGNVSILPKFLLKYRMHSSQISTDKKVEQRCLYDKVLIRNLQELGFDADNLKFISMLNENEKNIDFPKLSKFIDDIIKVKNEENNIHSLKKVLYSKFFVLWLKNGKIKMLKDKDIANKVFRFNNLIYIIKTIYYKIYTKFFVIK